MNNNFLQVKIYNKAGYKPTIDFEKWRVAYLNTTQDLTTNYIIKIERHMKSDEVFVLLEGECVLIAAGNSEKPWEKLKFIPMKRSVIYNYPKGSWHSVIMNKKSKILIVENKNTCGSNSEHFFLTKHQKEQIKKYKKHT
ncbi:MAG: hypothetical protein A3J83_04980 [Elusimicrobia bacterium RIFOXYA2_FULL_40_6]|nr:MAG: hypothetical protein A3J83_04980 [Elusimicrobia bacterium RIFOXYA2_FULL_40_6]